jgi:hypothetical protein
MNLLVEDVLQYQQRFVMVPVIWKLYDWNESIYLYWEMMILFVVKLVSNAKDEVEFEVNVIEWMLLLMMAVVVVR